MTAKYIDLLLNKDLNDPKVRIKIYEDALKDWDWKLSYFLWFKRPPSYLLSGFCSYFVDKCVGLENGTYRKIMSYELTDLKQTGFGPYWFPSPLYNGARQAILARRKALRQAIQICEQKIKSNG